MKTILALALIVLVLVACSPVSIGTIVEGKTYVPAYSWVEPMGYRYDCGLYVGGYGCGFRFFYPETHYEPDRYILDVVYDSCGISDQVYVSKAVFDSVDIGSHADFSLYSVPKECIQ